MSDMASPWKMGSKRITEAATTTAAAVSIMGRKRIAPASMTARSRGEPFLGLGRCTGRCCSSQGLLRLGHPGLGHLHFRPGLPGIDDNEEIPFFHTVPFAHFQRFHRPQDFAGQFAADAGLNRANGFVYKGFLPYIERLIQLQVFMKDEAHPDGGWNEISEYGTLTVSCIRHLFSSFSRPAFLFHLAKRIIKMTANDKLINAQKSPIASTPMRYNR